MLFIGYAFSWVFAFLGLTAGSPESANAYGFTILFPLTFLSNAFVPTETMPGWLQAFVKINPVTHIITAARDLCNTGTFGTDGWLAVIGATVVVAIFAPLTVRKYRKHVG